MQIGLFQRRSKGNYPYVTARVRAKKRFLLEPDIWPRLLARDVNEIARTLEEGVYKKEVDELGGRYRGAVLIERATRLNLGRTYESILSASQGDLKAMLALFLGRYDADNIRTILRGKFAKLPPEEILSEIVPGGSIGLPQLEQLARVESIEEVVRGLKGTPYAAPLEAALGGRRQLDNLFDLENTIDKTYYDRLLSQVEGTNRPKAGFKAFLRAEVDVVNLKTLFRLRAEELADLQPFFLEGGAKLDLDTAQRLLKAPRDELLSELGNILPGEQVQAAAVKFLETGQLGPVVTALDKAHLASAASFGHRYPLSVLPVIDFMLRKQREVHNLRILALGKQMGLPERTLEELIL
ncbi:MAG: ATP synthase A1 subunit C [Thermoplasmatota archaeon]